MSLTPFDYQTSAAVWQDPTWQSPNMMQMANVGNREIRRELIQPYSPLLSADLIESVTDL